MWPILVKAVWNLGLECMKLGMVKILNWMQNLVSVKLKDHETWLTWNWKVNETRMLPAKKYLNRKNLLIFYMFIHLNHHNMLLIHMDKWIGRIDDSKLSMQIMVIWSHFIEHSSVFGTLRKWCLCTLSSGDEGWWSGGDRSGRWLSECVPASPGTKDIWEAPHPHSSWTSSWV